MRLLVGVLAVGGVLGCSSPYEPYAVTLRTTGLTRLQSETLVQYTVVNATDAVASVSPTCGQLLNAEIESLSDSTWGPYLTRICQAIYVPSTPIDMVAGTSRDGTADVSGPSGLYRLRIDYSLLPGRAVIRHAYSEPFRLP